jgi:hypothetical protein
MSQREPLEVEVVAHVTGSMDHCSHCQVFIDGVGVGQKVHQEDMQSYPPDFIQEWQQLSDWILELAEAFSGQLVIRITDAQSVQGIWKAITKGVRKYPTFIIAGQEKYHGWNKEHLNHLLQQHLQAMER